MLNLAGLVGDSIVDGPGIRMTVFLPGMPTPLPRLPQCRDMEF